MTEAGDVQRPERAPGPWETEHLLDPLDRADAHAELAEAEDRAHQATCDVNLYPGEPCNIGCAERPDDIAASWAWLDDAVARRRLEARNNPSSPDYWQRDPESPNDIILASGERAYLRPRP